tara:strand:+ start:85 stop:1005 length:921 start_codon:yes stop_codon:yes gene_type:complete
MKKFLLTKQINSILLHKIKKIYKKKNKDILKEFLLTNKKFINFIKQGENKIKQNSIKGIIISFSNGKQQINPDLMSIITESVSKILGLLIIQNNNNDKLIYVYDRDRNFSMHKGSRYHQTREGGSIHTDNVNVKKRWDYMILSCLSSPEVGGENIFVNADLVYSKLKKFPTALDTLKKDFLWEKRGISKSFYRAPVLTFKGNVPEFRYLRPYMMSAYARKKLPMTKKQLYSLDTLDAILEDSQNQVRKKMNPGDLLLVKDAQFFHGRTSFSDFLDASDIFNSKLKNNKYFKRTMLRAWIKQKQYQL